MLQWTLFILGTIAFILLIGWLEESDRAAFVRRARAERKRDESPLL